MIATEMKFLLIVVLGYLATFSAAGTDDAMESVKELPLAEELPLSDNGAVAEQELPALPDQDVQAGQTGTGLQLFQNMNLKQNALSAFIGAIVAAFIALALMKGRLVHMKGQVTSAELEKARAADELAQKILELAEAEEKNIRNMKFLSELKQLQEQKAETQKKELEVNRLLQEALEDK